MTFLLLPLISLVAVSGLAAYALGRGLTGSTTAGVTAALTWALWPNGVAWATPILPLAVYLLHRLAAGREWRDSLALGGVAGLSASATRSGPTITAIALVVSAIAVAIATGQWRSRALWSRLLAAAIVGALVVRVAAPLFRGLQLPHLTSGGVLWVFPGLVSIALGMFGAWRGCGSDARPSAFAGLTLVAAGLALQLPSVSTCGVALLAAIGVRAIERRAL